MGATLGKLGACLKSSLPIPVMWLRRSVTALQGLMRVSKTIFPKKLTIHMRTILSPLFVLTC